MLLLVEDVNDNAPVFLPYPSTITVEEHSGPRVIGSVEARDRDSGIFGQVVYDVLEDSDSEGLFSVDGRGVISVVGDLDYETKSVYQLQVLAKDRASANFGRVNTATAAIVVRVEDIPDQPPEFVSVPSVTRISEDVERFSEVSAPAIAARETNFASELLTRPLMMMMSSPSLGTLAGFHLKLATGGRPGLGLRNDETTETQTNCRQQPIRPVDFRPAK